MFDKVLNAPLSLLAAFLEEEPFFDLIFHNVLVLRIIKSAVNALPFMA